MGFAEDLTAEVVKILKEGWKERDVSRVPEPAELNLANEAVKLEGTVLYADLADSTGLVMSQPPSLVATIYKSYLNCACRIIVKREGKIIAFDGDRVMAVFLGASGASNACRAAFTIQHSVAEILNPRLREQFKLPAEFAIKQGVGIDRSALYVAQTGVRGANDRVWVGRAANLAAKLCAMREGNFTTYITQDVLAALDANLLKTSAQTPVWGESPQKIQGVVVHRSACTTSP